MLGAGNNIDQPDDTTDCCKLKDIMNEELQVELLFIKLYCRQLSTYYKIFKIITSFVSPEVPRTWASKAGLNFMIIILIFVKIVCYMKLSRIY